MFLMVTKRNLRKESLLLLMLVLSRKVGERILLGDKIRITVVRVSGGGVRLGIEAPSDVAVVREEVAASNPPAAVPIVDAPTKLE